GRKAGRAAMISSSGFAESLLGGTAGSVARLSPAGAPNAAVRLPPGARVAASGLEMAVAGVGAVAPFAVVLTPGASSGPEAEAAPRVHGFHAATATPSTTMKAPAPTSSPLRRLPAPWDAGCPAVATAGSVRIA